MSHHRDSPAATADGRINVRDLPGSAAGPGSAASGQSGLLSGEVACQVEPLGPPSARQALLCRSRSRGDVAPGVSEPEPGHRPGLPTQMTR
jgi:hypothetical protein